MAYSEPLAGSSGGPAPVEGFSTESEDGEAASARFYAAYVVPELRPWLDVLPALGISAEHAARCAALARRNGTDLQSELLASGLVGEERLAGAIAGSLGLDHLTRLDADRLMVSEDDALAVLRRRSWHVPVRYLGSDGRTAYLVAPERVDLGRLRALISRRPALAGGLKIVAPGLLRTALYRRVRPQLARHATTELFERYPSLSARIVANAWQGLFCGVLFVALPMALFVAPAETWTGLHLLASLFYLSCVALRIAALSSVPPPRRRPVVPAPAHTLPVYSVLVALYREAAVVPQLLAALDRLEWPRSKLEVKLVCEADDIETLAALNARPLPPWIELVLVPGIGPRTKPRALAYALPLAGGEIVALYDAEDHPDPWQLHEAWNRFRAAGPELACLQAPLEISNRRTGALASMFGFEYAALFRALLPWLARRRLLLPLGGTSNHFRGLM